MTGVGKRKSKERFEEDDRDLTHLGAFNVTSIPSSYR